MTLRVSTNRLAMKNKLMPKIEKTNNRLRNKIAHVLTVNMDVSHQSDGPNNVVFWLSCTDCVLNWNELAAVAAAESEDDDVVENIALSRTKNNGTGLFARDDAKCFLFRNMLANGFRICFYWDKSISMS